MGVDAQLNSAFVMSAMRPWLPAVVFRLGLLCVPLLSAHLGPLQGPPCFVPPCGASALSSGTTAIFGAHHLCMLAAVGCAFSLGYTHPQRPPRDATQSPTSSEICSVLPLVRAAERAHPRTVARQDSATQQTRTRARLTTHAHTLPCAVRRGGPAQQPVRRVPRGGCPLARPDRAAWPGGAALAGPHPPLRTAAAPHAA